MGVNCGTDPRRSSVRVPQDVGDQIEHVVSSLVNHPIYFVQRVDFRYAEVVVMNVQEIAEGVQDSRS